MDATYKTSGSLESKDRLWLCRLLIVFALGETFVNYRTPIINLRSTTNEPNNQNNNPDQTAETPSPPPPGTSFFEQALMLLKLPYEEPSLEHIEILNLAVSKFQ
jgi:proline utilization trans-activator